jgi:hypothetical protein
MLRLDSFSSGLFNRVFGRQNAVPGNKDNAAGKQEEAHDSLSKFDYKGIGDTIAELKESLAPAKRNHWNFQALGN